MRQPRFAGAFYERGEVSLKQQLASCFEDERGPGATPPTIQSQRKARPPKAVIAPHAGYQYSGACAAWSYKAIADAPLADVYVILAPSHRSLHSGLTQETFTTPLGMVRVDQDLARRLLEKGTIKENPRIHDEEHAIEVQLPFLQFSQIDALERIKILPILVSEDLDQKQLAIDLKEALLEANKTAVYICSSDFTHYGRVYKYIPFEENAQEKVAALDKGAIDLIKALDADGFLKYVALHDATICGSQAIALLLRCIKAEKVLLEQYYTSAAVTGDAKNSVSYASIVFK